MPSPSRSANRLLTSVGWSAWLRCVGSVLSVLWVVPNPHSIHTSVLQKFGPRLIADPILAQRIKGLIDLCHQRDRMLEFKDSILREVGYVEWLVDDDNLMGEDRNDVLDWDNNNVK